MGRQLQDVVLDHFGGLKSGAAYKALTVMARKSLDPPGYNGKPPALYFGGWQGVAVALGRPPPPKEDQSPEARTECNRCRTAATSAISELVRLGIITPTLERARTGQRQVYRLDGLLRLICE